MLLIAVLVSMVANANKAFFQNEVAYSRASSDILDTGVIKDSPTGYQTWKNGYAQTSMKYDTSSDAGMWLWGSTTGSLDNVSDDNIQAIEGVRAFLYIREINQEIQIGQGGTFSLIPQVETDTATGIKQGHFKWDYVSNNNYKITVDFIVRSVRNHLQWKYTITNNSGSQINTALRVIENVKFPINNNVLTADRSSEKPFILSSGELISTETELTDSSIPSGWHIIYPNEGTIYTTKPFWKLNQDFTFSNNDKNIVKPNRLIFGDMARLVSNSWLNNNITSDKMTNGTILGSDSGVGLYYNSTAINNGATKVYCGNLMMGIDSSSVTKGTDGTINTNALTIKKIENLNTATEDIPVSVILTNASISDSIASISITPDKGLVLLNGASSTINNILINSERDLAVNTNAQSYTWKLKADATISGLIKVTIKADFSSGLSSSQVLYINVPASTVMNVQQGLHLVGFPYQFQNPLSSVVLGNSVPIAKYENSLYVKSNEQDFSIKAGSGYWMIASSQISIPLQGASAYDANYDYSFALSQGWNLISSPFIYGIRLGDCKISYDGLSYSIKDAIKNNLIIPAIYSFDSENKSYLFRAITEEELYNSCIQPFQGYWIKTNKNLNISFNGISSFRSLDTLSKNIDGWITTLKVSSDNGSNSSATIGVASNSGLIRNLIAPPVIPDSAEIVINSTGDNLSRQINYPSAKSVWRFTINPAPKKGELSLRWGSQLNFPGNYSLTLIDKDTGKRLNMRTNSLYGYSSTDTPRQFEIIAEKRIAKLAFVNSSVSSTNRRNLKNITINYQLTAPANVSMNIRSITGKNIATIIGTDDGVNGIVSWNGSNTVGKLVQSGLYLIELTAQDAEGTKVKSNIPVNIK
jgi:hypothetical protein